MLTLVIVILIYSCSGSYRSIDGSGYYQHSKVFAAGPIYDSTNLFLWYYDSSIIYEVKIRRNFGAKSTKPADNPVFYQYLDLRTLKVQDYFTLSDSSTPYCSYIVEPLNQPFNYYNLFSFEKDESVIESREIPTDTVVSGKRLKRFKYRTRGKYPELKVFYTETSLLPDVMQVFQSLNPEMKVEGKIVRQETDFLDEDRTVTATEVLSLRLINPVLNSEMKKIFHSWRQNISTLSSQLPKFPAALESCDIVLEIEKRLNGWYDQPQ